MKRAVHPHSGHLGSTLTFGPVLFPWASISPPAVGVLALALPTSQACRGLAEVMVVEEPVNLIKAQ